MSIRVRPLKDNPRFEQIIRQNFQEDVKDDSFAQHLYASLCNTIWYNETTEDIYSCSWGYAGGLVASMRFKGEGYLNFYCSGEEGDIHDDVYDKLKKLGYTPIFRDLETRVPIQEQDFE